MSSKPCRNQEMSWGKTVKPCINQTCNSGWFAISGQKSKISGHRQRGHSFFTEHLLTALGPEKARGDQRWSTGARLTNKYSFCIIVLWFWRNLNDLNEAMSFISMFQCVPWCSMMFHVFVPWLFPMFSRCFAAIKFGRFLQILTFLPEPDVFQKKCMTSQILDVDSKVMLFLVGGSEHVFYFPYMGCHPSHWRTHIFFKMGKTW